MLAPTQLASRILREPPLTGALHGPPPMVAEQLELKVETATGLPLMLKESAAERVDEDGTLFSADVGKDGTPWGRHGLRRNTSSPVNWPW